MTRFCKQGELQDWCLWDARSCLCWTQLVSASSAVELAQNTAELIRKTAGASMRRDLTKNRKHWTGREGENKPSGETAETTPRLKQYVFHGWAGNPHTQRDGRPWMSSLQRSYFTKETVGHGWARTGTGTPWKDSSLWRTHVGAEGKSKREEVAEKPGLV